MVPAKYPITVYRGATYESGDISRTVNGTSLNFADYDSFTLKVKTPWKHTETDSTEDDLLTLTSADGYIVVAGDGLSISIVIPAAETDVIEFETGRYFLDLHKTTGSVVHRMLHGTFTVLGEDDI